MKKALLKTRGNSRAAAKELRVSKPYFYFVLRKLGLQREPARVREFFKTRYKLTAS